MYVCLGNQVGMCNETTKMMKNPCSASGLQWGSAVEEEASF